MKKSLITLLMLLGTASGCGMSENVENMDKNMQRMADEIERDREYIRILTEQMALMAAALHNVSELSLEAQKTLAAWRAQFEEHEADDTPNVDDIEGETQR